MFKKILYVPLIFLISLYTDEKVSHDIEKGQIWSLEAKSNKLSIGNSKVLYFFQMMHITPIEQEGFLIGMGFQLSMAGT